MYEQSVRKMSAKRHLKKTLVYLHEIGNIRLLTVVGWETFCEICPCFVEAGVLVPTPIWHTHSRGFG
jgi:hypothetical protein